MRIAFLTSFGFFQLPNGDVSSAGASARYRITLPAKNLSNMGHKITLYTLNDLALNNPSAAASSIDAETVVVSKFFDARTLALVECLKRQGRQIVADFCDNHFQHPTMGTAYLSLAATADRVVCNTRTMADEIFLRTKREAQIIGDPVEGRKNPPRFAPSLSAIKFAWYGFPMGVAFLFKTLSRSIDRGITHPFHVNIVTTPSARLNNDVEELKRASYGKCSAIVTPWSTEAVWLAIKMADAVLVPSELDAATKTKSANRVLEAIYGGRLTIASQLPSYAEFSQFCILDDEHSPVETLVNASSDRNNVLKMLSAGQDYIERKHLPIHAALKWDKLFRGEPFCG